MALFFLAHARTCAARLLDSRVHTTHTHQTAIVGPVPTVLGRSHGCNPSTVCPSDRFTPHPCVSAVSHLIHKRPPDIHVACLAYPRSLSNTYFSLGLRRPRRTLSHRALALTRSGASVDLFGFGRGRSDMSDHEDAPAARGGFGGRARRNVERDDDHRRPWRRSDFPSDDALFARCCVNVHEDVPRHIHCLFLALGIQFRWLLTRTELTRKLVSPEDLAIDDAKENAWMALYEHDRDTLEDILYRRLQDLWAPLTAAMKVFDTHGSAQ
jgi:hypothetical protein